MTTPEIASLESDSSVIYCRDSDFRISFCNAAWDRFAMENNGLCLMRPAAIGLGLADYIAAPLLEFYSEAFKIVRATTETWQQIYECSSPGILRRFHMRVSLAPASVDSLLVVNSQISHEPMRRTVLDPAEVYRGKNGLVTMCANCRRTRRVGEHVWDWVPRYVQHIPPQTTHGLCPPCLVSYYPEAFN